MPNQIIPVQWGKPLRKSEVNTLDKVNELIDFINNSSIHELDLIASDVGREIATGTSTQLARLEVYGESVQDGTPTPENPVPVQVVGAPNLFNLNAGTSAGVTMAKDADGAYIFNGTSTGFAQFEFEEEFAPGVYTMSVKGDAIGTTATTVFVRTRDASNAIRHNISMATAQNWGHISNGNPIAKCVVNIPSGLTFDNYKLYVQLERGATVTHYVPYGCIGLQTGETVTPIDLQGHTLAGLPDGTQDVLRVDSAGRVWIEQNVGYLASYNGESVGSVYLSTTGALTTGASVYYKLDEPQTIELGTITPPEIPSGSVVKIDATLQPEFALTWFTENGLPLVIDDMRDYVDAKINEVNARIDELHGITRASLEVQSIPVDVSENENTENENTEVTENER